MKKEIAGILDSADPHWVGDGFPVHTVFSYHTLGERISPFLMLDHAGPVEFPPSSRPRGVGEHPHRGFETVTVVYQGEVEHRDSAGNGGRIGPGDVQWMTAASGLLHEEMHSKEFTRSGGVMEMAQLWVNLPARDKSRPPGYQTLLDGDIPAVELPDGAGVLRVIAGDYGGRRGPARTFTPIGVWDLRLNPGRRVELRVPDGHTTALAVLKGTVMLDEGRQGAENQIVLYEREGDRVALEAASDAIALVLSGEPIDEPVVGYGPFVMNTAEEIDRAIEDYRNGRMGRLGG
jgi:hypothetical protein